MRKPLIDLAPADDAPGQVLAPPPPRLCPGCNVEPLPAGEGRCSLCRWLDDNAAQDLRQDLGR